MDYRRRLGMSDLNFRAVRSSLLGILALAVLLFLPAWTLDYWQAWLFMAVFAACSTAITVYLAIKDPELLERRMRAGPRAETETAQKIAMSLVIAGFIALLILPGVDHRFGWSPVPPYLSLLGDVLVALGFLFIFFVIRENRYAA